MKLNVGECSELHELRWALPALALWFEAVAQSWRKSLGCSHFPHVSSVSRAAFVWCETGGPAEQSTVGSSLPLCSIRVRIPSRRVWVEVPGWTSNQPGAGSKDKIKPILKCSLLHSAEIGAYMPRDLMQLLLHSLCQELADNMEGVWFGFWFFRLFWIAAVKKRGKPNDMKPG